MSIAFCCLTDQHKECRVGHWCECACHATDDLEATPDRTNTESKRELVQKYKCVNCGYELASSDLSSIRCPKCDYKGLELAQGKSCAECLMYGGQCKRHPRSTNPKDNLDEILERLLQRKGSSGGLPDGEAIMEDEAAYKEAKARIQEYITLAQIAEHDWYKKNEVYQLNGQPILSNTTVRVVKLSDIDDRIDALQRDSQPDVPAPARSDVRKEDKRQEGSQ